MKKKMMICALGLSMFMLTAGVSADDAFPVTAADAYGTDVTMEAAPTAVVSMSPAATEILYAVGAGDLLVGRTDYCNYPAEAADVESIGSYWEPNVELILSKSPDLVFVSDYIDDSIRAQLEEAGAVICIISANDIAAIEADITRVGALTGHAADAEAVVESMEAELADIQDQLAEIDTAETAFIDLGAFYSAGPGSLLDNALTEIGLENICADQTDLWPMLSVETIIEKNPDLYISLYSPLEDIQANAGLEALECLNDEGGFIFIDGMSELGDKLQRPGPRFVEGIADLAELVYPDVMAADEAA